MANRQVHMKKYLKNKSLSETTVMAQEENNDWRTVIIYYAALHMVDSTYADSDIHPRDHKARKRFMEITPKYKPIVDVYNNLEMLSRKARYDSLNIKGKELEIALRCLERIEKEFQQVS